jgi:hypothetical protein
MHRFGCTDLERHGALMRITIKQAGEGTGKSKATILRAIKDGTISAVKDESSGVWMIDPAELYRVFPSASNDASEALHGEAGSTRREVMMMQQQLEELRHERERERLDKDRQIESLTRRLEAADEERRTTLRQLTAILTDQRTQTIITPPPEPSSAATPATTKGRSWWRFGKR